jgi:hypothetical protein
MSNRTALGRDLLSTGWPRYCPAALAHCLRRAGYRFRLEELASIFILGRLRARVMACAKAALLDTCRRACTG